MPATDRPLRRSDGAQTHAAILDAAVAIASREGLAGVSVGRLAAALDLSKSGVYAHFKSKQRLQMEIIEAAREIFFREVIAPGLAHPDGLSRLRGLCESFLDYVRREVFPGGCFFAGMMSEFDAQEGTIHDEVTADQSQWLGLLRQAACKARARRELDPATDPDQLVFELDAALELANYMFVLFGDSAVLERARRSIDSSIERHLP